MKEILLSPRKVAELTSISLTQQWRLRQDPDSGWPTPKVISKQRIGYKPEDIQRYIDKLPDAASMSDLTQTKIQPIT